MKKFSRLLALLLVLCLAMPAGVMADETAIEEIETIAGETETVEAAADDPVFFTFDGQEVKKSEVDAELYNLIMSGKLNDYDYDATIEYMIRNMLGEKFCNQAGINQFSAEEEEAFLAEATVIWDNLIESNYTQVLSEDTEEGHQLAREMVASYFYAQGINIDYIVSFLKDNAINEKLYEMFSVGITEEEVLELFESDAAIEKEAFENNIPLFEYYVHENDYSPWYIPEGFRGITHILLEVDAELMNAYNAAQLAMEEMESAEATEDGEEAAEPVTQADVDAALAAVLASCQDDIDAIYNWLESGETFENLIAIYGTDPGMKDEANLKNGYSVHRESIAWDPVFIDAAFSEKMQKPGDVSDPVVGTFGIHILYYLRDVPAGNVEITEEIFASIMNLLVNSAYNDALNEMRAETEITYNEEAIAAAVNALYAVAE